MKKTLIMFVSAIKNIHILQNYLNWLTNNIFKLVRQKKSSMNTKFTWISHTHKDLLLISKCYINTCISKVEQDNICIQIIWQGCQVTSRFIIWRNHNNENHESGYIFRNHFTKSKEYCRPGTVFYMFQNTLLLTFLMFSNEMFFFSQNT